jgi:hypothetical protein
MDRIASTTSLISGIVEAYDTTTFQRELNSMMESLIQKFEGFIEENAIDSGLITKNTIRPIRYFSVEGRIKERDSFHEKMIRSNLIYEFLDKKRYRSKKEILKKKSEVQYRDKNLNGT